MWKVFPSYLFDEISDKLIKDDYISVENAFNDVMNKYKISFSSIEKSAIFKSSFNGSNFCKTI